MAGCAGNILVPPGAHPTRPTPAHSTRPRPSRPGAFSRQAHGLFALPRRRRTARLDHFLHHKFAHCQLLSSAGACMVYGGRRRLNSPGSAGRGLWRRARSGPARGTRRGAGARRCSSTCRGRCWFSTPSSSCRGGRCRCTWPGAARAPAGFEACRPRRGSRWVSVLWPFERSRGNLPCL